MMEIICKGRERLLGRSHTYKCMMKASICFSMAVLSRQCFVSYFFGATVCECGGIRVPGFDNLGPVAAGFSGDERVADALLGQGQEHDATKHFQSIDRMHFNTKCVLSFSELLSKFQLELFLTHLQP